MREIGSIEQNIGNFVAGHMSAFDQHRAGAHAVNLKSGFFHVRNGSDCLACEHSRFVDVRRDYESKWEKIPAKRANRIPAEQRSSRGRGDHRIDDQMSDLILS